jgi:hypothetical protein
MAKRTRYPNRPAARAATKPSNPSPASSTASTTATPIQPIPAAPVGDDFASTEGDMPATSAGHLTDAEMQRAEQLEAEANAREKAAIAESLRRRNRAGAQIVDHGYDVNAPLAVRASKEYAYVARDVRRIVLTASIMVAILAVLAILINVMGVISI